MKPSRKAALPVLLLSVSTLGCCTIPLRPPPQISYDEETQPAVLVADPPKPVEIVEIPKPLPLPGQLKPVNAARSKPEPGDPRKRVDKANAAARIQPTRNGYINAVQVYPFTEGALYQLYAAPGQVTDIALQEGEQLVGSGPVAAGDTVRWIIGDTESGTGASKRIHILIKPTRPEITSNLCDQHRSPDLSSGTSFRRKDLHGLGVLAVSQRSADRAAPPERERGGCNPDCDRRGYFTVAVPLCDRGR